MIEAGSLWALVEKRAAATPDGLIAVDEADRELSFAEFKARSERAAAGLAALGVEAGTNVSWVMPSRTDTIVLVAALARLGAVQNPCLPIYRERELGFVARQTGARLLIVPGVFRGFD